MAKKETKIKYGEYNVCRADFERLHQLDSDEAKLNERADLAIKNLSILELTDTQNVKLAQRYIESTYPNSINRIKTKREEISKKYKKGIYLPEKLVQITFVTAFVLLAVTVILLSIYGILKTAV